MRTLKLNTIISAQDALAKVSAGLKSYDPAQPVQYKFLDEEYVGNLVMMFTALAIFIACWRLFDLATFGAEQRTKAIGVRKVSGVSVSNLWQLVSEYFVMLVLIFLFIATPVAYYFRHTLLQNYPYRSTILRWAFITTGIGALIIA